ncbi:RHS repeat-associated core domain-containing protein [Pseudomonas putida]|nr:RHS repeat-associated core domain-containing protein [Pseudomonas putida]
MSESKKIFYINGLPISLKSKTITQTLFRSNINALAELPGEPGATINLYSTDDSASILKTSDSPERAIAYTPYGYRLNIPTMPLLGFNGELLNHTPGFYLLGTGHHRAYSPTLMRFICPDPISPFGLGGMSTYAYCGNDPINKVDPSGHFRLPKPIRNLFGRKKLLTKKVETYNKELLSRVSAIEKIDPPSLPKSPKEYYLASERLKIMLNNVPSEPQQLSAEAQIYRAKYYPNTEKILKELISDTSFKYLDLNATQRKYEILGQPYKAAEAESLAEKRALEIRAQGSTRISVINDNLIINTFG